MNNQKQIKQDLSKNGSEKNQLPINEIFYSVQGEGEFTGHPAIFIRVGGGCVLNCYWCDTEYEKAYLMTNQQIYSQVIKLLSNQYEDPLIIFTGAEPFQYDITEIVTLFDRDGFRVHIETSGAVGIPDFPYGMTYITCSPKTSKLNQQVKDNANVFKYVIKFNEVSEEDGLPFCNTQFINGKVRELSRPPYSKLLSAYEKPIYISPCSDKNFYKNLNTCTKLNQKFGYIISLQTHKILGVK